MPPSDYSCKVINLESGYARKNRNWIISRLLRDNEVYMAKKAKSRPNLGRALRVAIYEPSPLPPKTHFMKGTHRLSTLLQLAVASIPCLLYGHPDVLLLTIFGTAMALVTGALPQWKAEKLPEEARSEKKKTIAITTGNGHKDVIILRNIGSRFDLEALSTFDGPCQAKPWRHIGFFTDKGPGKTTDVWTLHGMPWDFLLTCFVYIAFTAGWLALLILAAGLQTRSWYLLIVCLIGTVQNALVAGKSLHPQDQPIPLILCDEILGNKVMDALMDLQVTLEADPLFTDATASIVQPLREIYFPGRPREWNGEIEWWEGQRNKYDELRIADKKISRGIPRSRWFLTTKEKEAFTTGSQPEIPETHGQRLSGNDEGNTNDAIRSPALGGQGDDAETLQEDEETSPNSYNLVQMARWA
ncbi:hypothetical protein DIS24_g9994 [Lasiodiplodia hormozganensis]|uniref:Uncharacterized protein n=1 Tax=Lasiodiplodia hormozganensis TaxID=869390 RepID=A0AA39XSE5_9PEZI|nr:hypothetical protein DIS24_g9994 [Lasiodiplodia hormozganensis]